MGRNGSRRDQTGARGVDGDASGAGKAPTLPPASVRSRVARPTLEGHKVSVRSGQQKTGGSRGRHRSSVWLRVVSEGRTLPALKDLYSTTARPHGDMRGKLPSGGSRSHVPAGYAR